MRQLLAVGAIAALAGGCVGEIIDASAQEPNSRPDPEAPEPDAGAPDGGAEACALGSPSADASSTRHTVRPIGAPYAGNGYFEYLPPNYGACPAPLLVFFHGLGEFGDGDGELSKVLRHGPPQLIQGDDWPSTRPFVVLSPQHATNSCFTATEIRDFLAFALAEYDVDPSRVYATGLSCGAIGTWNYLKDFGDETVAAAIPIAGNGRPAWNQRGCDLTNVAIWAFHGDPDPVVATEGSTVPLNNIFETCTIPDDRDAQLTLLPGVGHNSWQPTYPRDDIYEWLLQFSK